MIDTPNIDNSLRKAALSEGLLAEIETWRMMAIETRNDAWVFPSERMTPLSKDNCRRRSMHPALAKVGLEWANFLVMRRTHATLMKALGIDGKLVADQLGHTLDVNQNVYTQSSVEIRQAALNQLEWDRRAGTTPRTSRSPQSRWWISLLVGISSISCIMRRS